MRSTARDIAISHFYWKPGVCLIRALELDAYLASGRKAMAPCLDLGCGDGSVSRMLMDAGVTDSPVMGLDISERQLAKACALGHYESLFMASADSMPFQRESFESVVCNGVLEALPEKPEFAIREAARVLKYGGLFFLTVPTERFIQAMLWPRLLGIISKRLASAYVRRFNRRLDHHGPYLSTDEWKRHLDAGGFEVVNEQSFLYRDSGAAYNLLVMHIMRPLSLLKKLALTPQNAICRILDFMIERLCKEDMRARDGEGGYVLFIGQKKS